MPTPAVHLHQIHSLLFHTLSTTIKERRRLALSDHETADACVTVTLKSANEGRVIEMHLALATREGEVFHTAVSRLIRNPRLTYEHEVSLSGNGIARTIEELLNPWTGYPPDCSCFLVHTCIDNPIPG